MCGRFTLILEPGDFADDFDLGGIPENYLPRYNIAPTQLVAVVQNADSRSVELFRWGLIPSWAKDPASGFRLINACAETLAEKPSFRSALRSRRNLILASGFYEWRAVTSLANPQGKGKQPLYIHMQDGQPFTFAGLWEEWQAPGGELIRTTSIITTSSNTLLAPFHERMPVILEGDARSLWLDSVTRVPDALNLLKPFPHERMAFYPVSSQVNNPAYDSLLCIQAVAG